MYKKKSTLIERIEKFSTLSNIQTLKNKLLIIYKENQQQLELQLQQQKQNVNRQLSNSNSGSGININIGNSSRSNSGSSYSIGQSQIIINQHNNHNNQNNNLNENQLKWVNNLINLLQAPERLLRSDPKIRFNFISSPSIEHDLFVPLKLNIDQLVKEIENFEQQFESEDSNCYQMIRIDGIDICSYIKLVIKDSYKFIEDLVNQVKLYNGNELALDLLEEKPILYTESHSIRSISLEKAFTLTSYDPKEYYFIRKNQSGNSIGSVHGGVYFKVDTGNTCLKPARENAIFIFYTSLFNDDSFISPSNLFFIDQIPILSPDSGESKEREELMKKKNELKLESSQEVLKRFPDLEKKILNLSVKRRISIQASLLVDGITLEEFLKKALNNNKEEQEFNQNNISYSGEYSGLIYTIDMESYSAHILASLLLIPSDYKSDNIIIENGTNKIIGIDNDLAMECDEIEKENDNKYFIRTKNMLYLLPQLNEPVHPIIRDKFIKHNPQIFVLNWLLQLLKSEKEYVNLVRSVLSHYPVGPEREKAERNLNESLMFPLLFLPNWVPEMVDRFVEIKNLLVNNPLITHYDLLKIIHPYSSLYFEALSKHYQDPFKKLLSIYNREFDFIRLLNKYPPDIDEADLHQIYNNLSRSARIPSDPTVPIISCIKGILLKTNITNFSGKDLLELVEIVFEVEKFHKIQNDQFHRSWYTSTIFPSIVRCGASLDLIDKFKKHFRFYGNDADVSIIHAAIESRSTKMRQLILTLSKWFDLEHSMNGYTPLDLACITNNIELFSFLVQLGAGSKASYVHIDNFYKGLTYDQKVQLKETMERLYHINPKSTWKISLNHLLPMQQSTNFIIKTASEGTRTIANRDLWNNLFYQNGSKPKKSNTYGSRAVPFIEDQNLNHRLYCKFWPQFPGLELSVTRLSDLLFGYMCPYIELASINDIPVLISQAVIGEPLNDVLLKYPERINQLEPSSISKMLVMAMLINPADGNLGNYIISPIPIKKNEKQLYKIISLDNDQAFMPARCKELKNGISLQVETVLFLFDQMKQPVHQEVYSAIKNKDLNMILKKWVQCLKIYQQNTMDLFSKSSHERLKQERTTVLSITFARGMIKKLYSKLIRLQVELNKSKDKPLSHLQLLEILEPIVATRYKSILEESHLSIYDRFKKLKRLSCSNNDVDILRLTSSVYSSAHLLESREIPNIKDIENDLWSAKYGATQIEAEIDEIRSEHLTFQNIFNNLDQNTSFLKVLDNSSFTDIFIENLLKQLDFNNITVDQEKALFKGVQEKEIRYLTLKNSKILNCNVFFKSFNIQSLVKIHFHNCQSMDSFKKSGNFLDQTKIEFTCLKNLRIEKASSFYANIVAPNLKECSIVQCQKFKFPIETKQNQSITTLIESSEMEELNFRYSLSAFPSANINIERLYQCYPNLVKLDISFAKFKNLEINFQHENLKIFIAKDVDLYKITFDGESKLEILDVRGSPLNGGIGIKHQSFFKSLKVLKKEANVNLDSSYIGTNYPGLIAIGGGVLSSYFIKELTTKISILGYTSHVDSFSFKGDFYGLFDIGITKVTKENETFDRFPLIANRSSTLLFIIDTSNSLLTDLENIFIHCNKYYKEKIEEMLYLGGIKPVVLVLCDDKEFDINTNNLKDFELLDRIEMFKLNYKIHQPTIIYHFNKNQLDETLISMESIEKDIVNDDFKCQIFNLVKDNHKVIMSNKYPGVLTVSFSLGKISDIVQYVNLQKSLFTNELLLNVCNKYNINPKDFIFTYSNPLISQKRIELKENITIEKLMSILNGSLKQIFLERRSLNKIKQN